MKSSQLNFKNPDLEKIDFEIVSNPIKYRFRGFTYAISAAFVISLYLIILFGFMVAFQNGRLILLGPLLSCISVIALCVVVQLIRSSKRYFQNPASIINDPRAPIVYLRSFIDDQEEDPKRWDKRTSEELITSALKSVGPVLTVADKHQEKKFLGATRIILGDDWQSEIEKLISISQFVIVEANSTKNLLWEIGLLKRIIPPERLIISFLSKYVSDEADIDGRKVPSLLGAVERRGHYEKFDFAFYEIFSVKPPVYDPTEICFFYFDNTWKALPLSLRPVETIFQRMKMSAVVQYVFSRQYKDHLPYWKIKQAILLILHYNGIVIQDAYVKKIETRREEESGFISKFLIEDEAATRPNRLLAEIDSDVPYKAWRRFFVFSPAVVFTGFLGLWILNMAKPDPPVYITGGPYGYTTLKAGPLIPPNRTGPAYYVDRAKEHLEKEEYDLAIRNYDRAIELTPGAPDLIHDRAVIYLTRKSNLKTSDYRRAIKDLTYAISLDRSYRNAYWNRALAYSKIGEKTKAEKDLKICQKLDRLGKK